MPYNRLSTAEEEIILKKGTETPFTGRFHDHKEKGIYICRQCNRPLFRSDAKFDSGTGWPSFDEVIRDGIKEQPDRGRTEVVCANCGGHLGHLFRGERVTPKNARYCINSLSLDFVAL